MGIYLIFSSGAGKSQFLWELAPPPEFWTFLAPKSGQNHGFFRRMVFEPFSAQLLWRFDSKGDPKPYIFVHFSDFCGLLSDPFRRNSYGGSAPEWSKTVNFHCQNALFEQIWAARATRAPKPSIFSAKMFRLTPFGTPGRPEPQNHQFSLPKCSV